MKTSFKEFLTSISFEDPSEYDFGVSNEGFISVCKNKKWGYVNLKGEMVVDFVYDYTQQFCDGVAWVQLNNKYNFVDTKGKILSEKWFEIDIAWFWIKLLSHLRLIKIRDNNDK